MATIAEILKAKKNEKLSNNNHSIPNITLIPTFYTQTKEGHKIASIKYAFLKKLFLTRAQFSSYSISYDTKEWKIVLDEKDAKEIKEDIAFDGFCRCIVSFQVHNFGNYAIYRKDKEVKKVQQVKEEEKTNV